MKKIITKALLLSSLLVAAANASSLTILDATEGTLAKLETSNTTRQNDEVSASVLWSYEIADATNTEQRSTRGMYRINCAQGTLALTKWEMFNDAQGKGDLIWADQADISDIAFRQPNRQVERTMINASCEVKTAMNN
jgi:hypothetical protein